MSHVIELHGDYAFYLDQEQPPQPFLRSIVAGETRGVGSMPHCNLKIERQINKDKLAHIKAVRCTNNFCRIDICAFN